jgi:hypothetical protein
MRACSLVDQRPRIFPTKTHMLECGGNNLHSLTVDASMGSCACVRAYREVESEIGPGVMHSRGADGHGT